jgi:hypothetical protein
MNALKYSKDLTDQITNNMEMEELVDLRKGICAAMNTIQRTINALPA